MSDGRTENSRLLPLLTAAGTFPLFAWLFFTFPSIPDIDSYYHLAVARLYRAEGLVRALPWTRFSVLGERLGDKELLFHLLLVPFAGSSAGGRIALALLNAAVAGVIGWIAFRAAGRSAAVVPLWLYVAAGAFFFRTFRLRPEVLALLLLLLLVKFLSEERAVAAAIVAAVFAASYTAFHVAAGLTVIAFVAIGIALTRWNTKLLLLPLAGTAAGLLLHPHFPDNLRVFWLQNALFFVRKSSLDVGEEILAPLASDILLFNLGWFAGLVVLWRARSSPSPKWRRETIVFTCAAVVFVVLFLFMERMAIYAIPFVTLALLFRVGDAGPMNRSLGVGSLSLAVAPLLAVCALASLPYDLRLVASMRNTTTGVATNEGDWVAMSAALPRGALVASPWGSAEAYCFWAPQGRYLNVLDPIFMAERFPVPFRAQRAIFDGSEPDVPFVAKEVLASDFLAFRSGDADRRLVERLKRDPRVAVRHAGRNLLVEFVDGRNGGFVTDWRVADPRDPRRVGRYRRPASDAARRREGFVELTSVAAGAPCVNAMTTIEVPASGALYEFAPFGPAQLTVDRSMRLRDDAGRGAVLGEGLTVPLDGGKREIEVMSCRGAASPRNGFYLLRRR